MRISSQFITKLESNEIFVFGSNLSGFHAGGAAKLAMQWGAEWGNPVGLQGQTYAIPTVKEKISGKLDLDNIEKYVKQFIMFAKKNSHLKFLVTEIGCGLAGHTIENIAPFFKDGLDVNNIYLPKKFLDYLNQEKL